MAQEPKMQLEGVDIPNVLEVSYVLKAEADKDGRPTRKQTCDGIRIMRIADDRTDLSDWGQSPKEHNRKSGDIVFMTDTGKEMKKLTFAGAYLRDYRVHYNEAKHHVEEIAHIQPEVIQVADVEVNFNWPDM